MREEPPLPGSPLCPQQGTQCPSTNNLRRNHLALVSLWPQWLSYKGKLQMVVHGGSGRSAWETPWLPSRNGDNLEEKQRAIEQRYVTVPVTGIWGLHKSFRRGTHFRELGPRMNNWEQNEVTSELLTLSHLSIIKWEQGG